MRALCAPGRFLAATVSVLAACAPPGASLVLSFPDQASTADTRALLVTAVEPIYVDGTGKKFLPCGGLSVFRPGAIFDRSAVDLPSLRVLSNRQRRDFPLGGDWELPLRPSASSEGANPWRAIMVHAEARGGDPEGTILEGCACFRAADAPNVADRSFAAEVEAACPRLDSGQLPIVLAAIAKPPIDLVPCGPTDVTAVAEATNTIGAAACLDTHRFPCDGPSCSALQHLERAAVRLELLEDGGIRRSSSVVFTDTSGRASGSFALGACGDAARLRASLVGRPEAVELDLECVKKAASPAVPRGLFNLDGGGSTGLDGTTVVPQTRDASGAIASPARIAALLSTTNAAVISVLEIQAGNLVEIARTTLDGERGAAIHGYAYRVETAQRPAAAPLLAVLTAKRSGGAPLLRIYRLGPGPKESRLVRVAGSEVGAPADARTPWCPHEACADGACGPDTGCQRGVDFGGLGAALFSDDVDLDGNRDLLITSGGRSGLWRFFSAGGTDGPPEALLEHCSCASIPVAAKRATSLRLGGPGLGGLPDLVLGEPSRAYVRYASARAREGAPCDRGHACAGGLECWSPCGDLDRDGRCLQRCRLDASACPSPGSTCSATTAGGSEGWCDAIGYSCAQPPAVLGLFATFTDVGRIRRARASFDDAVLLGHDPGGSSRGAFVRILLGGATDFTAGPEQIPAGAVVRLVPKVIPGAALSDPLPERVQVGDLNGDRVEDLVVLFPASAELRVWLGSGASTPAEIEAPIALPDCKPVTSALGVADLDGDGQDEIFIGCAPAPGRLELRWF
ncbi:MAG: VCBS repeat-containing protein [Myxococcota bacterium]